MSWAEIKTALNSKSPADADFKPLNEMIERIKPVSSKIKLFFENGTFVVPPGVTKITITAGGGGAGGGGGGGGGITGGGTLPQPGAAGAPTIISPIVTVSGGTGLAPAQIILREEFPVTPGQILTITPGPGGNGGAGGGVRTTEGGIGGLGGVSGTGGGSAGANGPNGGVGGKGGMGAFEGGLGLSSGTSRAPGGSGGIFGEYGVAHNNVQFTVFGFSNPTPLHIITTEGKFRSGINSGADGAAYVTDGYGYGGAGGGLCGAGGGGGGGIKSPAAGGGGGGGGGGGFAIIEWEG